MKICRSYILSRSYDKILNVSVAPRSGQSAWLPGEPEEVILIRDRLAYLKKPVEESKKK